MAIKIPWSDKEAALLLYTLIDVLHNNIDRKAAISMVSKKLRQLAILNGIDIDEKFRNENGIKFQMSKLEYAFTDGLSGMYVKTGWYYRIVEIYRNHPEQFDSLVKETLGMNGIPDMKMQDRYYSWLSGRVSPAQLSELYLIYNEINKYFVGRKILKVSLFQTTSLKILSQVRNTIEGNKFFRLKHKNSVNKMSTAIRLYISYIKEDFSTHFDKNFVELKENSKDSFSSAITKISQSNFNAETNNKATAVSSINDCSMKSFCQSKETSRNEFPVIQKNDHAKCILKESENEIETVDLSYERLYTFTTPVSFSYFGKETVVASWREVYTSCIAFLLDDYPSVIMGLRGAPIIGNGRMDVSDFSSSTLMTSPLKISDDIFVEGNYNSTNLMKRLRALIIMCNVDFKQIQISFRPRPSSGDATVIQKKRKAKAQSDEIDTHGLHAKRLSANGIPIKRKINTYAFRHRLNDGFKFFLVTEKQLAKKTIVQYSQSVEEVEHFLIENKINCTLDIDDPNEAQRIYDILMTRYDFVVWNNQHHNMYGTALTQYINFLRQSKGAASEGRHKRQGQKTIIETVFDVLYQTGKPMTVLEIYNAIVKDNLYIFRSKNPKATLSNEIYRACKETEARIKEGKEVLIGSEVDGQKVFYVKTSKEGSAYSQNQQMEFVPKTAFPWNKYETVLKQAFPKGFQKESGLDLKKLRKRWSEIHGEELKDSDDIVRLQLSAHCVDTGKRWYLAETLLSDEDRKKVLQYIDRVLNSGKSVLYYSSIYSELEQYLESTALTKDLLISYLLATCQDRYILKENYLTNDRYAKVNLSEEIKDVMVTYGRPIHTDELKRRLRHLQPNQVERELHTHPEFVMDAFHMYFHESMADLTDQELDLIAEFIQEELDDQGYMIGIQIQQKLTQLYPEIAERLSFLSRLGIRGAVAYKLRDRFTFSGSVFTRKGSEMNMTDIFAVFCQRNAPFTLDELATFAKECDSSIYLDTVHRNCTRISENEFISNTAIRWNIPYVDAAIALQCTGKYVPLKSIRYFDAFPFVGYPWNSYLLEQYVATTSKDFTLMHSSYAKNSTSGAVVRRDAGFDSFDEVLADSLANAPVALEKDSCLSYLVNEGYITRKKLSNISEIITRARMLRSQKG